MALFNHGTLQRRAMLAAGFFASFFAAGFFEMPFFASFFAGFFEMPFFASFFASFFVAASPPFSAMLLFVAASMATSSSASSRQYSVISSFFGSWRLESHRPVSCDVQRRRSWPTLM